MVASSTQTSSGGFQALYGQVSLGSDLGLHTPFTVMFGGAALVM